MGFFHPAETSLYLLKFSFIAVLGGDNPLAVAKLVALTLDGGAKSQAHELPSILSFDHNSFMSNYFKIC